VDIRAAAVAQLSREGSTAIPLLMEAFGDTEWRVRKCAVEALVGMGWRAEMTQGLIAALASPDNAALRNAAAEAFVRFGGAAVPAILSSLTGSEPDIQKFLVDILGDIGDRRVTTALIGLLGQTDENVAMAAVEALGKLRDARAVEPLSDILRAGRSLLQFSAVKALQEIGDGRAVEPLIGCLTRKPLERAALEALGRIGDLRVLNPIAQSLRGGTAKVRHIAVRALIDLHDRMPPDAKTKVICRIREVYGESVAHYLRECLRNDDLVIKRNAITLLGWMGDVQAVGELAAVYDEACKEELVAAFVRMHREGVPKLVEILPTAPGGLREGIARALGEIGDRKAVHGLIQLATDAEGHVRQSAAVALGHLADPLGVRVLLKLLEDQYHNVQDAASRALIRLKGPVLIKRLLELMESPDAGLRCHVAKLLGAFQVPEAKGRLMLDLKDPNPTVRHTALAALESLGGDMSEVFPVALSDEDPRVRLETVRILAKRPGRGNEDLLRPLLHDPDMWIRSEAIRLLAERGGDGIADTLLLLVNDPVGMIQIAVCEAMGKLGVRGSLPALHRLLSSTDPDVKQAAVTAVGEIGGDEVAGHVLPLLDDSHWGVRAAAAVALGRARVAQALPRLRELADRDPDQLVRESAHYAVDQLSMVLDQAS
jgi:HEAT repeat protein